MSEESIVEFQVVETVDGFHARQRRGNHETVWWTETYPEKRTALEAIGLLPGVHVQHWVSDSTGTRDTASWMEFDPGTVAAPVMNRVRIQYVTEFVTEKR